MIADTTFLINLHDEHTRRAAGRATAFIRTHRSSVLRTTIIAAGEFATGFDNINDAREFLAPFPIIRLIPEAAYEASRVDRELLLVGARMGENDTWIAGIARYYGEPIVSNDLAFRRVRGLKVVRY